MAAWATMADDDDAKTRVIACLGGPCSIPLLLASRAEGALLCVVQERRRRLLAVQPALAEVHWSSRHTGAYCAEALSHWRLTTNIHKHRSGRGPSGGSRRLAYAR